MTYVVRVEVIVSMKGLSNPDVSSPEPQAVGPVSVCGGFVH